MKKFYRASSDEKTCQNPGGRIKQPYFDTVNPLGTEKSGPKKPVQQHKTNWLSQKPSWVHVTNVLQGTCSKPY